MGEPAIHNYALAGVFTVSLTGTDINYGCKGESVKNMTVLPLPSASLSIFPKLICRDDTFNITGGGAPGVSGTLNGNLQWPNGTSTLNLAPANSFSTQSSASVTTAYSLQVVDENTCESPVAIDSIHVLLPSPVINWDTSVVIGQFVPLNAYVGSGYTYTWAPNTIDLDCQTCYFHNPISSTTVNATYTVLVQDSMQCYVVENTYRIKVIPKVSLDVPTAFTPNGDGINDFIFPGGWGLRKLLYFKVYNRWGQLIFESNDIKTGWDGMYQGVPQNMETYVYQVSAETLLDTEPILTKTGSFKLLR
jgi:gliding motility-associated-like protein